MLNTSDFIPIVGIIADNKIEIEKIINIEEYESLSISDDDKKEKYVFGWKEYKHIQQLNDNAFFEVRQIDPYQKTIVTTPKVLTINESIRDHLERRSTEFTNPIAITTFLDLVECVNNPIMQEEARKIAQTNLILGKTLFLCLHDYDNPPPYESHKIYYTILTKINVCHLLLKKKVITISLSMNISEKIKMYVKQYDKIIKIILEKKWVSDQNLTQNKIFDKEIGYDIPIINAVYPEQVRSYDVLDLQSATYVYETFNRPTPLQIICKEYIIKGQRFKLRQYNNKFDLVWSEIIESTNIKKNGLNVINAGNLYIRSKKKYTEMLELLHDFYDNSEWIALPVVHPGDDVDEMFETVKKRFKLLSKYHKQEVDNFNALVPFFERVFCDFNDTWNYIKAPELNDIIISKMPFSNLNKKEENILIKIINEYCDNDTLINTNTTEIIEKAKKTTTTTTTNNNNQQQQPTTTTTTTS